jgi:hypothetical protein
MGDAREGKGKKNVEIGKRDRGKTTNRREKVFTAVSIYKKITFKEERENEKGEKKWEREGNQKRFLVQDINFCFYFLFSFHIFFKKNKLSITG